LAKPSDVRTGKNLRTSGGKAANHPLAAAAGSVSVASSKRVFDLLFDPYLVNQRCATISRPLRTKAAGKAID